jgi:hypothetical protein
VAPFFLMQKGAMSSSAGLLSLKRRRLHRGGRGTGDTKGNDPTASRSSKAGALMPLFWIVHELDDGERAIMIRRRQRADLCASSAHRWMASAATNYIL